MIRSAQIALAQCGLSLDDEILAHAMLLALPGSFHATMQTLLVQSPLKSEQVISSVRNDWVHHNGTSGNPHSAPSALPGRISHPQNNSQRGNNKKHQRIIGSYCEFHDMKDSHWSKDC